MAKYVAGILAGLLLTWGTTAHGFSANLVWFEFRKDGHYRVYVNYTIPALKQLRESYVDFQSRKKAEAFYWDLIKGGEFYPPSPESVEFEPKKKPKPEPW